MPLSTFEKKIMGRTGALLNRITHHVHILEMTADSYRLRQSRRKRNQT
jgi:DNA replication protein DnaC